MSFNLSTMRKLLSLLIFFALVSSCEKETIDFRNKYVGSWNYTVTILKHNFDSIRQSEKDTIYYLGKISSGIAGNELIIRYTNSDSIILNIDELGLLSGFPNHYCSGEFEGGNNIHLFLRWGGLGGFLVHTIDGTKK